MQPIASSSGAQVQNAGVAPPAPIAPARSSEALLPSGHAVPTDAQVREAIGAANAALKQVTSDLEFSRDTETGKIVVRIVDADTQQIIRQFPSEEMLAIARALDRFEGFLIKQKA